VVGDAQVGGGRASKPNVYIKRNNNERSRGGGKQRKNARHRENDDESISG
jgi:hypothetical protein